VTIVNFFLGKNFQTEGASLFVWFLPEELFFGELCGAPGAFFLFSFSNQTP
jgi:hypothetical protein